MTQSLPSFGTSSRVLPYLQVLRPYQWIKNLLVFAPMFFAGQLFTPLLLRRALGACAIFCTAAGLAYLFNDWKDRNRDAGHPEKCRRPVASGRIPVAGLLSLCTFLLGVLFSLLWWLNPKSDFLLFLLAYLVLNVLYSFMLKHVTCLEIYLVAAFFVLRVLAGGAATDTRVSAWLFATVFFMSLFITVAKRRAESCALGEEASNHRKSLDRYSLEYMNNFLWTMAGISIVTYALYTLENKPVLVYSILPATYGITRFLLLVEQGKGGDPIMTVFKDIHLSASVVLFLAFIGITIYT